MTPGSKDLYTSLIAKVCKALILDPKLLSAIFEVESNWDTWAVRYEPVFSYSSKPEYWAKLNNVTEATERIHQKSSWGIGQIMGATSRGCGFKGPLPSLCDPSNGIYWSATYFKKICLKYPRFSDQVAAYNAGSATFKDDFKSYVNQEYVDKVNKIYKGG